MHTCSRGAQIAISLLGGLIASMLAFTATLYLSNSEMRGQLLAGDPTANRELPTTLNAFKDAADGTTLLMQNLSSPVWWVAVIIGGLIAALIIFRLMRRYV